MAQNWYEEELAHGVERFRTLVFPRRRQIFERLAQSQAPKALFITCADSRVVPALITHTGPGDLFVERNPGNIVPVHTGECAGESASIEYAVAALEVPHVIVCGHSDCGAMRGLLDPAKLESLPVVARWLSYAEPARTRLGREEALAAGDDALAKLTRINVLLQLKNLESHPSVSRALAAGRVSLHGWVYDIPTGTVWAYDAGRDGFGPWPGS